MANLKDLPPETIMGCNRPGNKKCFRGSACIMYHTYCLGHWPHKQHLGKYLQLWHDYEDSKCGGRLVIYESRKPK